MLTMLPTLTLAVEPSVSGEAGVEQAATPDAAEDIPTLKQVTVVGQAEDALTGSNTLKRELLEHLPAKNGSINEAISILPGVQLPEENRASIQGGEILPPNVSLSGGTVYQNNFQIDGFSNNSLLDPMADDPTSSSNVPGHPQAMFLPINLVGEIKVYRYNIPAAYGSFTGGVVDATIRKPEPSFFGEINYRTTRDQWTEFHVDDELQNEFDNAINQSYQPKFTKQDAGFFLNTPLNSNISLLTSYQVNHSKIPLHHLNERKDQQRRNETFLAKLAWEIDQSTSLSGSLQYSPYQGDYFYKYSKDSDFSIEGGGWQADLTFEKELPSGRLSIQGAAKGSRNTREAPQDLYIWLSEIDGSPSSKPWGSEVGAGLKSYEGSVGSLEKEQTGLELKTEFSAEPLSLGETTHQMNAGLHFENVRGEVKRDLAQSQYNWSSKNANPDIVCNPADAACINGEQVFLSRTYWPEESSSARINLFDLFVEDTVNWRKLEVRPGLRISYDDFMNNTNVAPRLAASFDLFGNGGTLLVGGWNRYYGSTLLSYKLREAGPNLDSQTRALVCVDEAGVNVCRPEDWPSVAELPSTLYRYSEAETPYSDETVLGIDQRLFEGRLKLTWVQREGRDEYAREITDQQDDGKKYYQLTNNGESQHDEYTLEWERQWREHFLAINATYQESTRSNESYDDNFYGDRYLVEPVWYEGDYIDRAELPRIDFSRPWIINLTYSARLPWRGVTFTNVTRYRSGYDGIDSLSKEEKNAVDLPLTQLAYKDARFPEAWTFDWKFGWELALYKDQALTTTLEINNVFNEKVRIGDGTTVSDTDPASYEIGRQFWLGMTYTF